MGLAWNENKRKAPHVIRSIAHSNRISTWIVESVLSEDTAKGRAKVLANAINLLVVSELSFLFFLLFLSIFSFPHDLLLDPIVSLFRL